MATHGYELLQLAKEHGVSYLFEASVGGGIPILRPLTSCLAANELTQVVGILNGTTNYILTRMIQAGLTFELSHNLMNGHTFLPARKLAWATGQLLGLEDGLPLTEALDALTERGEIVRETVAGEDACYLAQMQEAEAYVAFRLTEFCQRELLPPEGLTGIIDRIEAAQGIQYATSLWHPLKP